MILEISPKPTKIETSQPDYSDLSFDAETGLAKCTRTEITTLYYTRAELEAYVSRQQIDKQFNSDHLFPDKVTKNDEEISWGQAGVVTFP